MCLFNPSLREFDLDGGHLTGPIPTWIPECLPGVEELDLSYNRVRLVGRWVGERLLVYRREGGGETTTTASEERAR
jgi:hypothetical protein